jgi:2-polyprenyl-3-methyl-5-hydroxy-6-metoxy-1,4-benzoquinol methylase
MADGVRGGHNHRGVADGRFLCDSRAPNIETNTMKDNSINHFDEAAANWDAQSHRSELTNAVGEAILLRQVQPTRGMDVLDYGCGTGLLGLFLLPHVRSVTGADSSSGMLQVLEEKIQTGSLQRMRTEKLDLRLDPTPESRYHLIVANMVMHHIDDIDVLLAAFHRMLFPGGFLAIADLDTEPGLFHRPEVVESVYHHGFERRTLMDRLYRVGLIDVKDVTVHVIRKPVANGETREFPVFLIVGHRSWGRQVLK